MSCPRPTLPQVHAGLASATFRRRQGDGRLVGEARQGEPAGGGRPGAGAGACPRRDAARRACRVRAGSAAQDRPRPAVLPLRARPRLRRPRRRRADGRRAHRRLVHALPVGARELRRRRAHHRQRRRRGRLQARRRQRRHLPLDHAASRGARDARAAAGGGRLGAQLRPRSRRTASCCSSWRPRAGACSSAKARRADADLLAKCAANLLRMWCED